MDHGLAYFRELLHKVALTEFKLRAHEPPLSLCLMGLCTKWPLGQNLFAQHVLYIQFVKHTTHQPFVAVFAEPLRKVATAANPFCPARSLHSYKSYRIYPLKARASEGGHVTGSVTSSAPRETSKYCLACLFGGASLMVFGPHKLSKTGRKISPWRAPKITSAKYIRK